MFKEEKELWVKFACAALANCVSTLQDRVNKYNEPDFVGPDDMIDEEDVIRDDCNYAYQYADKMLSLFYDKFKDC